jgi:hypothetical protein
MHRENGVVYRLDFISLPAALALPKRLREGDVGRR